MNGRRGGAVYAYGGENEGHNAIHTFDHCTFIRNGIDIGNTDTEEWASGGALHINGGAIIQNSIIDSSYIRHNMASGEKITASGGAVNIHYGGNTQDLSDWNNVPYSIFSSNIVSNTDVEVSGSVDGGFLKTFTKIKVENNLIINNAVHSGMSVSGDYRGGTYISQPSNPYAPVAFINNTVAYNRMENPSGGAAFTPGLILSHNNETGQDKPVVGNNIVFL